MIYSLKTKGSLMNNQLNKDILSEIKKLSNNELIAHSKNLADQERALCVQILHHLMIIEDRRLYAQRGYGSLLEFAVKELKYSENAAYRRVQATRLMRGVPEVKEKIQSGTLSLTNAAQIQKFVRAEKKHNNKLYSNIEKINLIKKVENQSTRKCEMTLREISPLAVPKEKERVLSKEEIEIRFVADSELMKKLEQIKQLSSHKNPNPSYQELFHLLADKTLASLKKQKNIPPRAQTLRCDNNSKKNQTQIRTKSSKPNGSKRYINVKLKEQIWQRDGGVCSYKDPNTGRKCNSKHQLEYEHIQPVALGGKTELNNMRLLCRPHNALMAVRNLGKEKMAPFLNG